MRSKCSNTSLAFQLLQEATISLLCLSRPSSRPHVHARAPMVASMAILPCLSSTARRRLNVSTSPSAERPSGSQNPTGACHQERRFHGAFSNLLEDRPHENPPRSHKVAYSAGKPAKNEKEHHSRKEHHPKSAHGFQLRH